MPDIRVRIAPSPTGRAHIATARAALFNYIFAHQNKGTFILRIEDTDRSRSTVEHENDILTQLMWLGLTWDEGPIRQTDRMERYQERAAELKDKSMAYEKDGALYFRVNPAGPDVTFVDLIKGQITVKRKEIGDFVILRSDQTPIYNFAVVVDDIDMKISHVLRGEDHLTNTAKHVLLFQALGVPPPEFGHFPIILGPDGGKLSKRHGATSLYEFRTQGYLPETILNFVALLGWSPLAGQDDGDEIIDLKKMIETFRLEKISHHPAIFDTAKLDYLNGWYIRHLPLGDLAQNLIDWFKYVGQKPPEKDEYLLNVLTTIQERLKRLDEFPALSKFYYTEIDYPAGLLVFGKSDRERTVKGLLKSSDSLKTLKAWSRDEIQSTLETVVAKEGLGNGDVFWPVRVAVTGEQSSPPPVEVLVVLGKEKSLERIEKALELLSAGK